MATPYVIRTYRRFQTQCSFYYMGSHFVGAGTVLDVSKNGWRVEGDSPVQPGMSLSLSIILPNYTAPVKVDKATVRWVRGEEFGLQMLEMQVGEWTRLEKFISSLIHKTTCVSA